MKLYFQDLTNRKFKNISDEKRQDIINALEKGGISRKDAAKNFNVTYASVAKIYSEFCRSGRIAKLKVGGNKPKKLSPNKVQFIKSLLEEDCTLSLKCIKENVFKEYAISVCEATLSKYVEGFNFTLKRLTKVSRSALTETLINARKTYSAWFLEVKNEGRNILFFDETGFQITMRKSYGRSEKGKKAVEMTPGIKSRNKTVMACMWNRGMLHYKALVNSGNRRTCLEYMKELIVILEEQNISNAILIMDNASFHQCEEISTFLESHGHVIKFLPPYSPLFNPIEYMFSQWKSIVRSQRTNNDGELMAAIDCFKDIVTLENCQNYVRHATSNMIRCLSGINVFED